MPHPRLDIALTQRGLAESRAKAQALVAAGAVRVAGQVVRKASSPTPPDALVEVEEAAACPYVSRGGLKLAHALAAFPVEVQGRVCADIGASTGGFTDVLLRAGAAKVYAVDVGSDELHPSLRQRSDVVMMEQVNARYLTREQMPDAPQVVVCDASFISLTLVLPAVLALAAPCAHLVTLIKPQFEVGKAHLNKQGVVRSAQEHARVCAEITLWLETQQGWKVQGVVPSPITGPKGNIEFLLWATAPHDARTTQSK